jgi:Flagellar biosynthesis pathway, component FliP
MFLFSGIAAAQPSAPTIPIPAINIGVGGATGPPRCCYNAANCCPNHRSQYGSRHFIDADQLYPYFGRSWFYSSCNGVAADASQPSSGISGSFSHFFTMAPVWDDMYSNGITPYIQGRIAAPIAWERSLKPVRAFMFRQTRERELSLMVRLSKGEQPKNQEDVPTRVLIPAYIISELENGFSNGNSTLHSLYRCGYDRGQHLNEYGDDDAPSLDDFPPLQGAFVCDGRWLEFGYFEPCKQYKIIGKGVFLNGGTEYCGCLKKRDVGHGSCQYAYTADCNGYGFDYGDYPDGYVHSGANPCFYS